MKTIVAIICLVLFQGILFGQKQILNADVLVCRGVYASNTVSSKNGTFLKIVSITNLIDSGYIDMYGRSNGLIQVFSRNLITTNGYWLSNRVNTAGIRLDEENFKFTFGEVPIMTMSDGGISVTGTVVGEDFVGTFHGDGSTITQVNAAVLYGSITNPPTLTNNWHGTFTGSVASASIVQADTLLAATFNAGTLNATNITVSGDTPLSGTKTFYASNSILNTVVISNGLIMSWSP